MFLHSRLASGGRSCERLPRVGGEGGPVAWKVVRFLGQRLRALARASPRLTFPARLVRASERSSVWFLFWALSLLGPFSTIRLTHFVKSVKRFIVSCCFRDDVYQRWCFWRAFSRSLWHIRHTRCPSLLIRVFASSNKCPWIQWLLVLLKEVCCPYSLFETAFK